MRGLTTASAALLAAGAGAVSAAPDSAACARGLHIVVARGTGEPPGAGVTGLLAAKIAGQVAGSAVSPLDYPATFTSPDYEDSVADGVRAMQGALDRYTAACPDGKVAVMGYSQVVTPCPGRRRRLLTLWSNRALNCPWMPSAAAWAAASTTPRRWP